MDFVFSVKGLFEAQLIQAERRSKNEEGGHAEGTLDVPSRGPRPPPQFWRSDSRQKDGPPMGRDPFPRPSQEKPPKPTAPTLTALGKGKLRVSWARGPSPTHRKLAGGGGGGGRFATFGKMIDPLVVKDSFLRGSPIFSQKVAKRPRCLRGGGCMPSLGPCGMQLRSSIWRDSGAVIQVRVDQYYSVRPQNTTGICRGRGLGVGWRQLERGSDMASRCAPKGNCV